ncbi:hypothetical protein [Phytoactinopolyspora halotolerans]|uniref:Uncharacterized protein n=1 Tax=Phytoactinopolyspora halotolerans TaxID=1981512 RepID=A0A6L9SDS5_9ACTN|nr:hypothetical protein [Phytoactinopolyspora halotolerans]NEE03545.1 hypothetical protein [Phytoactinopolyspora halotolerans]
MTRRLCTTPARRGARGLPAFALLLSATLALGACSGDDDETAAGDDDGAAAEDEPGAGEDDSSGDPVLDFYQCLRDNGLDVEDPGPSGGGGAGLQGPPGVDMHDPETEAIVEDCAENHLNSTDGRVTVGGEDGQMGDNLAEPEALIAYVDCMREHGIDMPDPDADGRLSIPDGVSRESAEFQQAAQDCAEHLDGGGILVGGGEDGAGAAR